jgi:hypothetical protein
VAGLAEAPGAKAGFLAQLAGRLLTSKLRSGRAGARCARAGN